MHSVRWRKAIRDLGTHPLRTTLVVLSIAVGVFAVGTIAGSSALLRSNLRDGYAASRPASAALFLAPFDTDLVDIVSEMPGIAEAEGRRSVTVVLKTPDGRDREMLLSAIPDFEDQRLDLVDLERGDWPSERGEVAIERSSLRLEPLEAGEQLTVQTPDGRLRELDVSAITHEVSAAPAFYSGRLLGHVAPATLLDLGFDDAYDELRILAADPGLDRDGIQALADAVRAKLERAGATVFGSYVPVPGEHPANELLQGFFLVLGVIGALSLVVSGFLVVNTVAAILAQQTRQIGVMKAIGARNDQIAGLYLGLVFAYALLALAVALPLGALGAWGFTVFTAGLANFDVHDFGVPIDVLLLEVAVGLLVPLLAALVPVWRGVRVTVREALATTGITDRFGRSRLDRLLRDLRGLSRPTLMSIRNTFRRKGRLALTLAALSLGGAIFMSVFSVRSSLQQTLDDTLAYFAYDVQVELPVAERVDVLTTEALRVPGVAAAEPWQFATVQRVRDDGAEGRTILTFGLPPDPRSVRPTVQEGRWLDPADGNAVVATANLLEDEPDLQVGDEVTLRIDGQDTTWTLVGIVASPTQRPFLYTPTTALGLATHEVGRAGILMVIGGPGMDAAGEAALADSVRAHLESAGVGVAATTTSAEIRATQETLFDILVVFLSSMAILLGAVGGLGLMGTMTINVVERSREVGVLRAVGASDGAVLRIVLAEGALIGILSWAIGALVALPISKLLADALGDVFIRRPLAYAYSVQGAFAWAVIVVALAVVASWLPAWRASRITVREVLAYE
ncbi:MAG TPA: FtsX-like permease family protein [Candidatus Limnocylindrales bacterium]